jgi:hypothetical protein
VQIAAFVPQPVRRPDPDDLSSLIDTLPPEAREHVTIRHGHSPLGDPAFTGLCEEEGVPYVDLVVRVRPRDVDYRSLIRAVVNQDFPMKGRTRLIATLFAVNEDRPALFDLPDDRWFGVAMPDAAPLRAVYESGLAPAERVPKTGDGEDLRLLARAVAIATEPAEPDPARPGRHRQEPRADRARPRRRPGRPAGPLLHRRRTGREPLPRPGRNSVGKVIETLLRHDLIVCDEVGFAPLDSTGSQLLFRFLAAAYECRSLAIASH